MKTYAKNNTIRKPMMYGGGASMKKKMMGGGNATGNMMAAGMRKNKMGMMGMKHGGKAHYGKKK